jgi:pyridinium-3,5-biscarboxylic acid mononucleotide sulfurtransferase
MDSLLQNKCDDIVKYLSKLNKVTVAYSGGVDSSLLLWFAKQALNENVLAFTVVSNFISEKDVNDAKSFAEKLGVKHYIHRVDEVTNKDILENPVDRCYYCKKEEFSEILKISKEKFGIETLVEGTNADDASDYRPGIRAVNELGVLSPLKEFNFTKQEIREVLKINGFEISDKPSSPCLASRIPYNTFITNEILTKIENSENYLHELGFRELRVRYHNDVARIEISAKEYQNILNPELLTKISKKLKTFGFKFITLDMEPFRTGSLNGDLNG